MKRSILALPIALFFALFVGTPAAFAGSNGPVASTDGSTAQWMHQYDYFNICDTDADGDWVYVEFYYSGSGGNLKLNWTGGANTCVARGYNIGEGKTVHYRSCQDDAFNDTCSGWKSGVA